jgi:hypothetical protein
MSLINLIKEEYSKFLKEYEEYTGHHKAPGKKDGYPLHDITDVFGDDFYTLPSNEVARYYDGFKFLPPTNKKKYKKYEDLIDEYTDKVTKENPNLSYDDIQKQVSELMYKDAYDLKGTTDKYSINPGDWVAINREYAVNHGKSVLANKYKILTKTVRAKDLYKEGYIEEWGYDPQ